ncbi:aKG-HExxH-type peptide beta-hydroxylase [Streptomyces sp. NPDC003393]
MSAPERFRLPLSTLTAVATGRVGDADLALLRSSQRSRLLLALAAILAHREEPAKAPRRDAEGPTRPAAAWDVLVHVQRHDPSAVEAVLEDPCVGSWAFPLLRRLRHGAAAAGTRVPPWAEASLFAALAGAAAVRAGVRATVRIPAHHGRVWLPSLGVTDSVGRGPWAVATLEHGPHGTVVFGGQGSVRLPDDWARPADGWHPLPRPGGSGGPYGEGSVTLDHLSPFRDFRSLTDPVALSPRTLERWHELLAGGEALLRRDQPEAHRLVAGALRTIVPVDGPSTLQPVSATVPDAHGAVTMSLPLDAAAMAAILVHEARHQLLSALADLTPLFAPVHEGPEPTYFAPWRADARPLRGLLFGAHAFTGVMSFWLTQRTADQDRAEFESALHHRQVRTALAQLRNAAGQLTRAGGLVVEGIAASFHRHGPLEPVTTPPRRLAELAYDDEQAAWRVAHLAVDPEEATALARRLLAGRQPPAHLPPARMRPAASHAAHPSGGQAPRTWLARLRCTDGRAFAAARRELGQPHASPAAVKDATLGDALLVADDTDAALDWFRRRPASVQAWIGVGLAHQEASSRLLRQRPELVLALHHALRDLGANPPAAEELAAWLDSRPTPAGSDAQGVDVAVGPDAVGRVPGGLVIDTQHAAE